MPLITAGVPLVILTNVGGVLVDAVLSDELILANRVSDNPVESGGVVSDHVIQLPLVLNMIGRISDTPFTTQRLLSEGYYAATGVSVTARTWLTSVGFLAGSEALAAFGVLRDLRNSGESFTVVTNLDVFNNMVFETLSIPRTSADGRSLRFSATIRQLIVVDSAAVVADNVDAAVAHTAADESHLGFLSSPPQPAAPTFPTVF